MTTPALPDGVCVDVQGAAIDVDEILMVRRGPGANCSSIGSALDVLFLTATVAGAILVAIAASMADTKGAVAAEGEGSGDESEG